MPGSSVVRIATFNIKHGARADGYLGRASRVTRACAELDADILALQEVDRFVWRSGFADLARAAAGTTYDACWFARATGFHPVAMINPGGHYGLALLARGEILERDVVRLTGDHIRLPFGRRRNVASEPRIAMLARVRVGGMAVSVANTHFGGPLRQRFLGTVATALGERPGPRVLVGDFNTMRPNTTSWLTDVSSLAMVPTPPEGHLPPGYRQSDHVAVEGLDVRSVTARWFDLSDHPALVVEATAL